MASNEVLNQQTALAKQIFGDIVEAVTDYDEHHGHQPGVDLIAPSDSAAAESGITILFTNGRKVRISTSEWTNVQVIE